jgi:hypothetical protein
MGEVGQYARVLHVMHISIQYETIMMNHTWSDPLPKQ